MDKSTDQQNVLDMGRAVSVALIRQLQARPVKVLQNDKNPTKDFKPDIEMTAAEREAVLRDIEHSSEYNIGIHTYGNLVDIDQDGQSPYMVHALDAFLPACSHVWGRRAKPRSHRLYMVEEVFIRSQHTCLSRLKAIASVEVRGGATNMYSVLPGSVHPSGELYEWSDIGRAKSSPSVVKTDALLLAVRKAALVDLIAPYWQEGMRNELTLALAGFLHRCYDMAKDDDEGPMVDLESARVILEVLMDVAGDNEDDKYSRLKTLERTWEKAEKGNVRLTGAQRIQDISGDKNMARNLYALMTDNPAATEIDEFLSQYCVFKKGGCAIDIEAALRGDSSFMLSKQQLENAEGHRGVMVSGKYHRLATIMFNMKATTRVSDLTLKPYEDRFVEVDGRLEFNQWAGMKIPMHVDPQTVEDVRPFIDYIRQVICNGDAKAETWVLSWLADIIQEPSIKPGTCLVMVGLPGTGKSFLGHSIMRPIIGKQHSSQVNSIEHVTANFNSEMDNKIFVQCDEATNSRQRSIAAKMKAMITEDTMRIEPKGINAYQKPNLIRFMFTSNDEEDAIHLGDGKYDRRYTVLKVSEFRLGDIEYWNSFRKWLDGDGLSRVHRFLKDYSYSKSLIRLPHDTVAKRVMQASSWEAFDSWLASWVARGHPLDEYTHEHGFYTATDGEVPDQVDRSEWPDLVAYTALELDFKRFCQGQRGATPMIAQRIFQVMKDRRLVSVEPLSMRPSYSYIDRSQNVRSGRLWLREVPTKERILQYLDLKYGYALGLNDADNEIKETTPPPKSEPEF